VIKEIKEKIQFTGIRNVAFGDSSFTVKKAYVEEFCKRVIEERLNIRWNCYSRANIDPALLSTMREAGLVSIEIGLESASNRILENIKKNIDLTHLEKICREAHRLGLRTFVFCMVSFPGETVEDVDKTIAFVKKISPYIHNIGLQVTRIMPDAALAYIAMDRGILPRDFNWFRPYRVPEIWKEIEKSPLDESVPLYIEHLSVRDIREKLDEFDEICRKEFSYFATLKGGIQYNLSANALSQLTLKSMLRKTVKTGQLFLNAYRNRHKHN
jgi:hypothetical protein